jgi:hypothetical protein
MTTRRAFSFSKSIANNAGLFLMLSIVLSGAKKEGIPDLKAAIRSYNSKATLVTIGDVDSSCGENKSAELVVGDFDGDGRLDSAVLLKIGNTYKSHYIRDGFRYPIREVRLELVVFMNKGEFYQPFIIKPWYLKEPVGYPLNFCLEKQIRAKLQEFEGSKIINLKYDAIAFTHCESSTIVYYWDGKKFSSISTSG